MSKTVVTFHEHVVDWNVYAAVHARSLRALIVHASHFDMYDVGDWLVVKSREARAVSHEPLLCEIIGKQRIEHPDVLDLNDKPAWCCVVSLGMCGFAPLLELVLPRPVRSLKNGRQLSWSDKGMPLDQTDFVDQIVKRVPTSKKSKGMREDIDLVRRHANLAVAQLRGVRLGSRPLASNQTPFGVNDKVELRAVHLIGDDRVAVRAIRVGTLPEGGDQKRGTKRDVHGMIELLADALSGTWWPDDRQLEDVRACRDRD